jgi:phenylpropionate dioxygenase-like ring-hydroxylating dioxygenase large terminal subunit
MQTEQRDNPQQSTDFLHDLWYLAALGKDVGKDCLTKKALLNQPVLLGRGKDGKAFALRDICPHRGMPLSKGRFTPEGDVECPYHGWRFGPDGSCRLIPSLVGHETAKPEHFRVRSYPVREQDGLIWIYMADKGRESLPPASEPPRVPIDNARPRWTESQVFHCPIDHAVIGLMDPAHAPYVHGRWWWRVKPSVKEKRYEPLPTGFKMARHSPTKTAYKLLGADVSTEITFELPSTRFENIAGTVFGRHIDVVGLTACTPIDAKTTLVTQIFYWPTWLFFIKPFFLMMGPTFLSDDRRAVEMQREGLEFSSVLTFVQDADVPALWYYRLKKAWNASNGGMDFTNPLRAETLRWKS